MTAVEPQSSKEARIKLVEAHMRAENDHDIKGILATFGRDSYFLLNGVKLKGYDGIQSVYEDFGFGDNAGISGSSIQAKMWHVADTSITLELLLSGTHSGEWRGIPATGRKIELPLCAVFTFDDDNKLESERVYFDMSSIYEQLGANKTHR